MEDPLPLLLEIHFVRTHRSLDEVNGCGMPVNDVSRASRYWHQLAGRGSERFAVHACFSAMLPTRDFRIYSTSLRSASPLLPSEQRVVAKSTSNTGRILREIRTELFCRCYKGTECSPRGFAQHRTASKRKRKQFLTLLFLDAKNERGSRQKFLSGW